MLCSSSSYSQKLESVKQEIKCVLIANSREGVTLDQLPNLYESVTDECIPFQDFNFYCLKDFLSSIPDAVSLFFDKKTNHTYVYPVESSKTKHISSLISRQKKPSKKKALPKPKLINNYIDPNWLKELLLELSIEKCIIKDDLLSEIQAVVGKYSWYTIRDLNAQLNELSHILTHDEGCIYLKSSDLSQGFIKQQIRDRLCKLLTEMYPEGIWCEDLPDVYRKEFGRDLEYRNLGFEDIAEFIAAALPSHTFKCSKPPKQSKYKVARVDMPLDNTIADSLECDVEGTLHAQAPLPTHTASLEVARRLIPEEFMNFDSVEQINVDTIMNNSKVIVSEICNPSRFWIILHRNKRKLIRLMDDLQEFYHVEQLDTYKIPSIVLKPGLHVACLYSKRWHRARIISNNNSNCMVQFYDYGTTKAYQANSLYFLHKKFCKLPAQAIQCCLYNVKPSCKEWTREAIEKFTDETIEKNFVVSIHKRNQNNSITVDLKDAAANLSIAQWLVSQNLATRGSNERMINVNKISSSQDHQEYSNYIRQAKQLEVLQKYKTRFKSSNSIQSLDSSPTAESVELETPMETPMETPTPSFTESSSISAVYTKKDLAVTKALKELQKLITITKL